MSEHTPAPWWVTDSGVRDRGGYIAHTNSVQHYEGQDERYAFEVAQREADKRLIAAAPDLLEALQGIVKWADVSRGTFRFSADEESDSVQRIYAAIAKATQPTGRKD